MKRNLTIVSLLLLTFFMVRPAVSADLIKGFVAHSNGDYATALREWKLLAEQGDADAQTSLGFMYDEGIGVLQDYKIAIKWFRKVGRQGIAEAQYKLGSRYASGHEVIKNNVYAHMWFNVAASSGQKTAAPNRDIVAKRMSSSQMEKAQDLARQCVKKKYRGC
jgi:TPR repeat protein